MTLALTIAAALALCAWLYLVFFRSGFWRADQRLDAEIAPPVRWPKVAAVIPARDEADVIARAVGSLLRQDYPGELTVILADDGSTDGTAERAREAAVAAGAEDRLRVVNAPPLAPGWTGKLWAVNAGVAEAPEDATYLLLTDADIEHHSGNLRGLVAKAETEGRHLVSLMVRLHSQSFVERMLIPAFVFFFQKLYPFRAINDPGRRIAGAAGGCMLVRRDTLQATGSVDAIRDALIDDCALARQIKAAGPIWLGLTEATRSLRRYDGLGGIWRMVARTAYTQLGRSPLLLAGTVFGMAVVYLAPALTLVLGIVWQNWLAATMGGTAQILMYVAYAPTRRLYRDFGVTYLLLPLAGLLYAMMTIDSARRQWLGKGGGWKGRTYAREPAA